MTSPIPSQPLKDFIDRGTLEYFLDLVVETSGLPTFVHDPTEEALIYAPTSPPVPRLCQKLQTCPGAEKSCKRFFAKSIHQAILEGPFTAECHLGLSFTVGPLIFNQGTGVGAIIAGYCRSRGWRRRERAKLEYWRRKTGMNKNQVYELVKAIPSISADKLPPVAEFVNDTAEYLMKKVALESGRYKNFIKSDLAVAREVVRGFDEAKDRIAIDRQYGNYHWSEEKELIEHAALGKRNQARQKLNEIIAKMYMDYQDNQLEFKGRIMELAVLITRAPLYYENYSGAEPVNIRIPEFYPPAGYDRLELKHWLMAVLEQVLDATYENRQEFKSRVVRATLGYINAHLEDKLQLKDLAKVMGFSSQQLNRIFLEEIGISAKEYITKAKIQEAKKLLKETDMNVTEIAQKLNYWDATHFAKVFRKWTGWAPSEFRKRAK